MVYWCIHDVWQLLKSILIRRYSNTFIGSISIRILNRVQKSFLTRPINCLKNWFLANIGLPEKRFSSYFRISYLSLLEYYQIFGIFQVPKVSIKEDLFWAQPLCTISDRSMNGIHYELHNLFDLLCWLNLSIFYVVQI